MFYFLKEKVVACDWKPDDEPWMSSNDYYFLDTPGMTIRNYRNSLDQADVNNILFSGAKADGSYPTVYEGEWLI